MKVRGLLLDIEGVFYQKSEAIEGARETLQWLRDRKITVRFLTNVTTRSRRSIAERLRALGFDVQMEEVFSASMAAVGELKKTNVHRIHVAAHPDVPNDFSEFMLVDHDAEAIVLGDLDEQFTWPRLNQLFQMLLDGSKLIALHKNRYCQRKQGLSLDLGPFVAALEYAANVEAVVVGKPAREFFEMALTDMSLASGEVLMVGDDLEADIGGAATTGLRTVQVETGKYRPQDREHPSIRPDFRIASIEYIRTVLDKQ